MCNPKQDAQLPQQDSSLSLEDCLQLLEDEYSPDTAQTELSPGLSQREAEQRWQDLATISELQGSIPEILPNNTLNNIQEGYVEVTTALRGRPAQWQQHPPARAQ